MLTVCAGDAVARVFPYGPRRRSVSDLGNQYVPFHAHLMDLLHGRADGGLLINWQSGYGTSLLPDLGTYLSSPFAALVVFFPKDHVDLALYVITLCKMASAAAAMTVLLLTLRPGRWWAAAILGASYALCGWSVLEATYNPMWLDGLIGFPLLCLVGAWVRGRRRPVLAPVVVALVWVANFYTAYMATIGAALVLLLQVLVVRGNGRVDARALLRGALTVLLGIALSAPLLCTVFLGTRHAHPGRKTDFTAAPWADVFARTLPATYSFSTPALFLGTGTLLLACTLAFQRKVPSRVRLGWTGLVILVALSFQWQPTHLLWHAFATPNGSPYRQTFVLSGLLVIAAWTAVEHGLPERRALLAGGGVTVAIGAAGGFSRTVTVFTYPLFALGLAAVVGALVLLARSGRRRYVVLGALLLAGAQMGQAAATTAYADRVRVHRLDDYPPWGTHLTEEAAATARADDWPRYRTDPGREQVTGNDPLLVGGQGAGYYSSMTSDVYTRLMGALGGGWTSHGRNLQSLDNPVTDALFAVGARVHSRPGAAGVTVTRSAAPPLVTVRPPGPVPHFGPSPFRNQEALLGARVYSSTSSGRCPAGTDGYLWAPDYTGPVRTGDGVVALSGGQHGRRAALLPLGTAPADVTGSVTAGASPGPKAGARVRTGCLDPARLAAAVERLRSTGATSVSVRGASVRAQLPPGSRGTAVFAMPRISGWRCHTGTAPDRPARSYLGLVAVPLDGHATTASCTFRPPGLRMGSTIGLSALIALLTVAAGPAVRRLTARPRRQRG